MKTQKLNIIPHPKKVTLGDCDAPLTFKGISTTDGRLADHISSFVSLVERIHGVSLTAEGGIKIELDARLGAGEYRLSVSETDANIAAGDEDGATYALSTLTQLAAPCECGKGICLPRVEIEDKPDCEYRALMVDLARKWHPFETLLGYVDLCYLYKIKFLHLHFIDTQSFTLPSRAFPKMPTEDRHYSFEQIDILNEYARKKNIEIIPEMEVPGHAKAMVTAYPELFADTPVGEGKVDDYALFFADVKKNIICVGKPGIMDTLRTLTEEIISMFPYSRYLHIGGDEAAIGDWANCRDCTAYMKEHGIDGPRPLYTEFIKRMTDMVLELGKTPIVWEGFPKEGSETISKKVIVTAWESYYQLAPELIEGGFKITNSSWEPLYTVPKGHRVVPSGRWTPEEVLDWNIYTWRNWNKKTAAYEKPIIIEPTDQVLGATFCAWENNYEGEIDVVRENLAAMSEKVWNINSDMTHEELKESLEKLLPYARKITV